MTAKKNKMRVTLEELNVALVNEQFFVEYQPIMRIDGKQCLGGATDENLLVYARANVDLIKLDKSVADGMLEPDWAPEKIGALEAFTHSTKVNVIAEGVETEYQRDLFQKLGVKMAQGWFYSYPLSAEKLIEFFRASTAGELKLPQATITT